MTEDKLASEQGYELAMHGHYLDTRSKLNGFQFKQSLEYDKTAITIASGALGLSLTFIKDIVGNAPPNLPILLWIGWATLVVAILATLTSFQLSVLAYARQREILDEEYQNACTDRSNSWTTKVNQANTISLIAIVVGVSLLTGFVATNTWRSNMTTIKRGAPPPTTPSMPRPTPGAGSPPASNPAPPPPPRK